MGHIDRMVDTEIAGAAGNSAIPSTMVAPPFEALITSSEPTNSNIAAYTRATMPAALATDRASRKFMFACCIAARTARII